MPTGRTGILSYAFLKSSMVETVHLLWQWAKPCTYGIGYKSQIAEKLVLGSFQLVVHMRTH